MLRSLVIQMGVFYSSQNMSGIVTWNNAFQVENQSIQEAPQGGVTIRQSSPLAGKSSIVKLWAGTKNNSWSHFRQDGNCYQGCLRLTNIARHRSCFSLHQMAKITICVNLKWRSFQVDIIGVLTIG